MNFFQSKEHILNWSGFETGTEDGIISLQDGASLMGTPRHSERLSGYCISSAPDHAPNFFEHLRKVTINSPFWVPPTA